MNFDNSWKFLSLPSKSKILKWRTKIRQGYAKDNKSSTRKISKAVTPLALTSEAAQSCARRVDAHKQYTKAAKERQ